MAELEKQVIPNPTGKGGFKDNPQNINKGGWSKEHSYSYWLRKFLTFTYKEFKDWEQENGDSMTMAQAGAWARVAKSIEDSKEFEIVANRTEGQPTQKLGLADDSQKLGVMINLINLVEDGDKLKESERGTIEAETES